MQNSEGAFASPIEVEERENFLLPPPLAEVQMPFSSLQAARQLSLCHALKDSVARPEAAGLMCMRCKGYPEGLTLLGKPVL